MTIQYLLFIIITCCGASRSRCDAFLPFCVFDAFFKTEVEGLSKQKAKFREPGSQNPGTGKLKTGNREAKIREKKTGNREAKIREPGRKSFFSVFFGGRRVCSTSNTTEA